MLLVGWPEEAPTDIEAFKSILACKKGQPLGPFQILRALPHGHVAAALAVAKELGLEQILGSKTSKERQLALALIIHRVLQPASKLATSRALSAQTATSSLAQQLGLGEVVTPAILYSAMDWLLRRQSGIEKRLAKKHLSEGAVVLYDLTPACSHSRGWAEPRVNFRWLKA